MIEDLAADPSWRKSESICKLDLLPMLKGRDSISKSLAPSYSCTAAPAITAKNPSHKLAPWCLSALESVHVMVCCSCSAHAAREMSFSDRRRSRRGGWHRCAGFAYRLIGPLLLLLVEQNRH